jgi:peptidoglycan hydrolase CwlO-like protein
MTATSRPAARSVPHPRGAISSTRDRLVLAFRRVLVTTGVVLSILVGALTIQAAGAWTAESAPLTVAPISAADIQARLDDERARSAALEQQIARLDSQSTALAQALTTARDRMVTDTSTAGALQAKLDAAQKRLVALNKALKAAAVALRQHPTTVAPAPLPAANQLTDD